MPCRSHRHQASSTSRGSAAVLGGEATQVLNLGGSGSFPPPARTMRLKTSLSPFVRTPDHKIYNLATAKLMAYNCKQHH